MSNEGVIKVLSDIDNLTDEKLDEVAGAFLSDFKDGSLAARGWLPVASAYAASKARVNARARLFASVLRQPGLRADRQEPRHGPGLRGGGGRAARRARPAGRARRLRAQLRAVRCVRVLSESCCWHVGP